MWWWVGTIALGIFSLAWILSVMAGVFRKKYSAWSGSAIGGYIVHGVISIVALWMFMNAIG